MVATKSNVNVKIDTTVKETATMLLDRMSIDQTTAIPIATIQPTPIGKLSEKDLRKLLAIMNY